MSEVYNTRRWRDHIRPAVLARDGYMDQLELRLGRHVPADTIHHIFPVDRYPKYKWCTWNMISLSRKNHEAMHLRKGGELSDAGRKLMEETAQHRGIKLSTLTLIIGLPGSGKTTFARRVMGGGLVYDLDYIAAAFRLRKPHEENHEPSRRMANNMVKAFAANAQRYASDVYVIRAAPYLDDVIDMEPDRIVLCEGSYNITNRKDYEKVNESQMMERINDVIEWAQANDVVITRTP